MPRKQNRSNPDYFAPFPKVLRSLMEETGATQQDIADKIGKTRQAVSYYTDGSSSPDRKTLCQIADFFGVSTDYLLGQTDVKTPDTTIQAICAYTGLDESAVKYLHDGIKLKHSFIHEFINALINYDNERFTSLCSMATSLYSVSLTPEDTEKLYRFEFNLLFGEAAGKVPGGLPEDFPKMADFIKPSSIIEAERSRTMAFINDYISDVSDSLTNASHKLSEQRATERSIINGTTEKQP